MLKTPLPILNGVVGANNGVVLQELLGKKRFTIAIKNIYYCHHYRSQGNWTPQ
jgi:hypothetical protein